MCLKGNTVFNITMRRDYWGTWGEDNYQLREVAGQEMPAVFKGSNQRPKKKKKKCFSVKSRYAALGCTQHRHKGWWVASRCVSVFRTSLRVSEQKLRCLDSLIPRWRWRVGDMMRVWCPGLSNGHHGPLLRLQRSRLETRQVLKVFFFLF